MVHIFERIHRHRLARQRTSAGPMSVKQELTRVARNLLQRHGAGYAMLQARGMRCDLDAIVQTEHVGFCTCAGNVNLVLVANEDAHVLLGLQNHVVAVKYLEHGVKSDFQLQYSERLKHGIA